MTALKQKDDDRWQVSTPKGDIIANKIVIAAGQLIIYVIKS